MRNGFVNERRERYLRIHTVELTILPAMIDFKAPSINFDRRGKRLKMTSAGLLQDDELSSRVWLGKGLMIMEYVV